MTMGDLIIKVPLFLTGLFPLGTYHALSTLDLLHMFMVHHSLLSKLNFCELYMTDVVLGHLQKMANVPQIN